MTKFFILCLSLLFINSTSHANMIQPNEIILDIDKEHAYGPLLKW